MISMDNISRSLFSSDQARSRLVIGGLLSFVPLLNIVALGYLYRALEVCRREQRLSLPSWGRVDLLLVDSLRCLLLWLVFFALPIAISTLLGLIMKKFLPEFAAPAAWLVVASGYVKAPVLFAGALHLYQKANDLKSLVKLPGLMMSLKPRAFELIMPIAAFWGLLVLLAPLYGFVLFTGSIVLTLYLTQFFALPVQEDIQHG